MTRAGSAAKSFLGLGQMTAQPVMPGSYRPSGSAFGNSGWLFDNTGSGLDVYFSYNNLDSIVKAYEQCAPVYSIINKQAYAFTNGNTLIKNTAGKDSNSPYAKSLRALLNKPNALQNGKQFEAQAAIYLRLFGYCVLLPIKPSGFPNTDATALWIIPPYMCELSFAKQTFFNLKRGFITNIKVKYGDEETNLIPDDVIVLRDITPGFDNLFLPGSPIKPLAQNISNLMGIYNSKGMLINYRGALGILTPEIDPNGAIAADPEEKETLQNDLMRYGLKSGQWKFIVANSAMKWQQMGVPYRDLMLTEWAEDDTMIVCDALNYPYKLMANSKSSSMNGTEVDAFKKILYQDFVIPFADMVYEQLSEAFEAEKNNCTITKDYSHVPVLQGDALKKAQSRKAGNEAYLIEFVNNLITMNEWRAMNGCDPLSNEFGNNYYHELVALGWKFGERTSGSTTQNTNDGNQQQPAAAGA